MSSQSNECQDGDKHRTSAHHRVGTLHRLEKVFGKALLGEVIQEKEEKELAMQKHQERVLRQAAQSSPSTITEPCNNMQVLGTVTH